MNLTRRSFLHASLMAGGLVAVPQFGRWFRPPERKIVVPTWFTLAASTDLPYDIELQYPTASGEWRSVPARRASPTLWIAELPANAVTGSSAYFRARHISPGAYPSDWGIIA